MIQALKFQACSSPNRPSNRAEERRVLLRGPNLNYAITSTHNKLKADCSDILEEFIEDQFSYEVMGTMLYEPSKC